MSAMTTKIALRPRIRNEFREQDFGNPFFPAAVLRRESNRHPMVMFAALSAICLGSMALVPTAGTPFYSMGSEPAAPRIVKAAMLPAPPLVDEAGKGARLVMQDGGGTDVVSEERKPAPRPVVHGQGDMFASAEMPAGEAGL